jgi:aspartate 1-decarboxylase
MRTKFLAAKLHCTRVTQTELNYHGSITLDKEFLEISGMKPLEFVCIWNKAMARDLKHTFCLEKVDLRCVV